MRISLLLLLKAYCASEVTTFEELERLFERVTGYNHIKEKLETRYTDPPKNLLFDLFEQGITVTHN